MSKKRNVCPRCGKKITIWDDPQKVIEAGMEKEYCKECLKEKQREVIKELSKTEGGRLKLYNESPHLIRSGLLWFIIGIVVNILILLFVAYSNFPFVLIFWGLVVYGFYNILRGVYYKLRYHPKIGE